MCPKKILRLSDPVSSFKLHLALYLPTYGEHLLAKDGPALTP